MPYMPYSSTTLQPYMPYMPCNPTVLQPYNPPALHALHAPHALQPSVTDGYNKCATLTGLRTELLPAEVENNH
jgi:hypothetical protein